MLKELVELAIKIQDENIRKAESDGIDRSISHSIFLSDFKTIHINVGRRSGKTRYIIDNAKENDVVLGFNRYPVFLNGLNACYVCSLFDHTYKVDVCMAHSKPKKGWDILYIDEPKRSIGSSWIDDHQIRKFVDYVQPNRIIMLGE